jgi:hypothetical protein
MKNLKNKIATIALFCFTVFIFNSCSDALDMAPEGKLTMK